MLAGSLALTAAAASIYRNERISLGQKHYAEGEAFSKQSRTKEALGEYRTALLFLPDETEYRLSLATALLQDGRLDEAEAHLQQLADEEPANPLIHLGLARIAAKRHRSKIAIQDYQRAVYEYWPPAEIPERRAARWELVNLLQQAGRRTEMVGELIQLYASSPPDPAERDKIGFALMQEGATAEAKRIFSDVLHIRAGDSDAQRGVGNADFATGDFVAARHAFQRALRLNPADRDSAKELTLTNSVIEADAMLPGISEAERQRRSANLLRRVLENLSGCTDPAIQGAQELFVHPPRNAPTDFEDAAELLWKQRASMCGGKSPSDMIVDLVLGRRGNE